MTQYYLFILHENKLVQSEFMIWRTSEKVGL